MSQQLPLAMQLHPQKYLQDFFWQTNQELKQFLLAFLGQEYLETFLYVWGGAGCGKTHLLQASCQAMPHTKSVAYCPLSILQKWGPESLEGMDDYALIALDDLDVIAGDPLWEEALFHFYNRIRNNAETKLIVSSHFSPTSSPIHLPDLRSRLSWGMVYQIHPLDDETKICVLQQEALKRGFVLSSEVAIFLLKRYSRNLHRLHQLLDQLDKASLIAKRKVTIPFIKEILSL